MGKLSPDPSPNPATVGSLSSTDRVVLSSQKEGEFWGRNCLERGGVDKENKGKRDAQKRWGFLRDVA